MSKINLSFAGCGFLGIYHVGVASCFREYAPHAVVSRIAGASVGSVAAAALICDVSLGQTTTDILAVAGKARSLTLGPLSPRFNLNLTLRERLEKALPENAHQMCSGRLFISVTRWSDKKNVLLSQFDTREELIQAILCSCFIPGYSGLTLPKFKEERYVDGGLSDNLPVLDDDTVTVSPFAGEHDICPQDESFNIMQVNVANTSIAVSPGNMYRFYRILFPPKPEILSKMCEQGFDDALRYLQRRRIISCTRCLGVKSVVKIQQNSEKENELIKSEHEFDGCEDCKKKRNKAKASSLPDQVVSAIQDACDQVNKGLYNYLFNNKLMKFVKLMGIPYTLSYDLSVAIFIKVLHLLPDFRQELLNKFQDVISLIKQLITKLESKNILYRAMFSCELSITEFNYAEEKVSSCDPIQSGLRINGKTENERVPRRKFSMKRAMSAQIVPTNADQRQQRKSYAGFPNNNQPTDVPQVRRKSLGEAIQPERVIRNMKFGFTVGVVPDISSTDRHAELFQSLKSLGDEDNELNIMELAKTAIVHQHCTQMSSPANDNVTRALVVPDSNPLMSYCYMDDDKTIKINEIYNVTDADSSLVLSDEERVLNSELQWENNWINPSEYKPGYDRSFVDSLDDHEFDYSDNECDITSSDVFLEAKEDVSVKSCEDEVVASRKRKMGIAVTNIIDTKSHRRTSFVFMNQDEVDISKPHRKTSFVIVK